MIVQVKPSSNYSTKTMDGTQQKMEANILLLGAENVGKSALTVRFLTRRFIGEYGDIESIYNHNGKIDGRKSLSISGIRCIHRTVRLRNQSPRKQLQWADGLILVYSICDRSSFDVARQQVHRIRNAKKNSGLSPVIIVGNKRDLQHRRTVSSEEGRLLALSADCGFFEISAAETYHGVLLVFHELFDLIRETRALKKGGIKGIVRSMSAVFGRKRAD